MSFDADASGDEVEPRRSSDLTAPGELIRMGRERAALHLARETPRLTIQIPPHRYKWGSVHLTGLGTDEATTDLVAVTLGMKGITVDISRHGEPLRIWDLESGRQLKSPSLAEGYAHFAAGAEDKVLVNDPFGDLPLRVHDLTTGRLLNQYRVPSLDGMHIHPSILSSPNFNHLASTYWPNRTNKLPERTDDEEREHKPTLIWPIDDPDEFFQISPWGNYFDSLALSPDGYYALVEQSNVDDETSLLELWNISQGKAVWTHEMAGTKAACACGDSRIAVLVGYEDEYPGHSDKVLLIIDLDPSKYDPSSGAARSTASAAFELPELPDDSYWFLASSYDGSLLVIASLGGVLVRWGPGDKPRIFARVPDAEKVMDIAMSDRGDALAVYCQDRTIHFYDL